MCWWNDNSGAVQAICAILGVAGLLSYCLLTYGIRRSAVAQQKAAQAPMIMFFWDGEATCWRIRNYGVGNATKVWWKTNLNNERTSDWYELGALASDDVSDLPHDSRPDECQLKLMHVGGARIHYSDMAGNHYATAGRLKHDAFNQMDTDQTKCTNGIAETHVEAVGLRRVVGGWPTHSFWVPHSSRLCFMRWVGIRAPREPPFCPQPESSSKPKI
jgi:hypothetical protein